MSAATSISCVILLICAVTCMGYVARKNSHIQIRSKLSNGNQIHSIKMSQNVVTLYKGKIGSLRNYIVRCCGSKSCRQRSGRTKKNSTHHSKNVPVRRSDVNGPSNKLVRIGKSKYKFPKEKATLSEAKKICENSNMELSTFNSVDETSKVSEYLNFIGLGDNPLFTTQPDPKTANPAITNWGKDKPPGGPGNCLVQQNGFFYNATCDQKSNFACEEKPLPNGVTTTLTPLMSIEDAVLNFVGGKNIVVPKEQATPPQAEGICAKQGLELMSLESLAQLDSVKDFLGDMGLSTSTVMTSMKKVTDGGANWLGDLASALVPPTDPAKSGDCLGIGGLGLMEVSCDTVSNFLCQSPDPTAPKPSLPPVSDLSSMFSSLLPLAMASPISLEGLEYLLPAEKATFLDAKKLCASRNMDLLSLQTPSETDLISSFLNSQGLGTGSILTALSSPGDSPFFSWDGSTEATGVKWAANEPAAAGDCASLSLLGMKSATCEVPSNFMCEGSSKTATTGAAETPEPVKEDVTKKIAADGTSQNIGTDPPKANTPPPAPSADETPQNSILSAVSTLAPAPQATVPTNPNPAETTPNIAPAVTSLPSINAKTTTESTLSSSTSGATMQTSSSANPIQSSATTTISNSAAGSTSATQFSTQAANNATSAAATNSTQESSTQSAPTNATRGSTNATQQGSANSASASSTTIGSTTPAGTTPASTTTSTSKPTNPATVAATSASTTVAANTDSAAAAGSGGGGGCKRKKNCGGK